jgi:hypothetical protein
MGTPPAVLNQDPPHPIDEIICRQQCLQSNRCHILHWIEVFFKKKLFYRFEYKLAPSRYTHGIVLFMPPFYSTSRSMLSLTCPRLHEHCYSASVANRAHDDNEYVNMLPCQLWQTIPFVQSQILLELEKNTHASRTCGPSLPICKQPIRQYDTFLNCVYLQDGYQANLSVCSSINQ